MQNSDPKKRCQLHYSRCPNLHLEIQMQSGKILAQLVLFSEQVTWIWMFKEDNVTPWCCDRIGPKSLIDQKLFQVDADVHLGRSQPAFVLRQVGKAQPESVALRAELHPRRQHGGPVFHG